jgi:hypothetical protein
LNVGVWLQLSMPLSHCHYIPGTVLGTEVHRHGHCPLVAPVELKDRHSGIWFSCSVRGTELCSRHSRSHFRGGRTKNKAWATSPALVPTISMAGTPGHILRNGEETPAENPWHRTLLACLHVWVGTGVEDTPSQRVLGNLCLDAPDTWGRGGKSPKRPGRPH